MIQIGEYVRTTDGKIGKIIKYENFEYHIKIDKDEVWKCSEDFIVKHSKQLIDLIEVGDYVNGKLIHKIDKGPNYCYLYYGNGKTFVDYQINNEILTKEQYMANCYRVGGEDE